MYFTKGARYSALLHGILLILMIFGLPSFMHRIPDSEPMAISVDILPIAPMSNIKPQEKTPEKVEPKKPEEQKTERKATQETKKSESSPAEEPIPVPAKEVVKQKPKKEQKPKPKPSDDLDSILKSVKNMEKSEESKKPTEKAVKETHEHEAKSQNYNPDVPLSMSDKDAIRNQFQKCWNLPAGAKDAYNLIVTIHVEVNEDGTVTKAELASDENRYNSDSFFRAAADSAIRAVERCSPLKNLPADKYSSWRDMELTFDPKDMLY